MKIEVIIEEQPLNFIRRQAPDARKSLRAAIHRIERGETFPVALRDDWTATIKYASKTAG